MAITKTFAAIVVALVAVQLVDIAIHVGTGQAEPVRIVSNVIIGLWAAGARLGIATAAAGLAALVAYLGLNVWFLAENGLTNPAQGDAPRLTLFVLVGLTSGLTLWLHSKVRSN